MVQQSTYIQLDLDVGEAVSLFHMKGRSLRCLSGTLWVTEIGERKDLALAAGEVYRLTRRGRVVIQAVGPQQGATCLLTPPPWYPILRGTTQQALFDVARDKGYDCDYRALRPADLVAAQGVWLISAITLAARVHTLDGSALPQAPIAADFTGLVDAAIVSDR